MEYPAVPYLHGRRCDDGFRPAYRKPEELPFRSCCPVRYLRRILHGYLPGIQRQGSGSDLHHRRCRRPYLHFPCRKAGTDRTDGTDRGCCIFLHGAGADYTAAYHEASDHRRREKNQDGTASSCIKAGENSFPNHCYNRCLPDSSYNSSAGWYADAWQPVP